MRARHFTRLASTALLLGVSATWSAASAQTTWFVDVNNAPPGVGSSTDPYASIQYAMDRPTTLPGDTISVAPGEYLEDIVFSVSNIDLVSQQGPLATTLRAVTPNSTSVTFHDVFHAGEESFLQGFTLQGVAGNSRGTYCPVNATAVIDHCIVQGYKWGCEVRDAQDIVSSNLVGNEIAIYHFGGGLGHFGDTLVNSCILWNNAADLDGLFISNGASINIIFTLQGDPTFWSPNNQHLLPGSPAIDSGSFFLPLDEDGSVIEQGAVPYDANYPEGDSYCVATVNSTGSRGALQLSGSARISSNDLVLSALNLPANTASLFFIGTNQVYTPLGNGFLCSGGQVARLGVAIASGSGTATRPFDNTASLFGAPAVTVGQTRYFQSWYRDVPAGGALFNFTNAVAVTFFP